MKKIVNGVSTFINKRKKMFDIFLCIFIGLYVFSFMLVGSHPSLYILTYPVIILFGFTVVLCFISMRHKVAISFKITLPLLFVVMAIFSTLAGTGKIMALKTIALLTISLYLVYICSLFINNTKIVLLSLSIGTALFTIIFTTIYFKEIFYFEWGRLGDKFGNVNDVGINLFFSFAFLTITTIAYRKYFFLPLVLLPAVCSLTTGSKKAVILLFVFALVILVCLLWKHKIILIIVLATLAISVFLMFSLPAMADIKKRFVSALDFFQGDSGDGSTQNRFLFLETSIYLGAKNLLLGLGANGFALESGFNVYSHNNFGEVFCNFGLFGLLLFYLPTILLCRSIKNYRSTERYVVMLFLIFNILSAFSLVVLDSKIYFVLLGLCFSFNSCTETKVATETKKAEEQCFIQI